MRGSVWNALRAGLLLSILAAGGAGAQPQDWRLEWPRTDFAKRSVGFDEILSGGPPRDGIPALDAPKFASARGFDGLSPLEPVISVVVGGDARAYPLRILMWHEIVNDAVGGLPIAITYCPLCNTGIVFDRRVGGQVLDFGTTGKLRHSDLVMYDRQTESWWQQFLGEGIVGRHTGERLRIVASRLESWRDFLARAPASARVLLAPEDVRRSYGVNPYRGYDGQTRPYDFFTGALPKDIAPMARLVVVREEGRPPEAWSLDLVRRAGRIETEDGRVLVWMPGQVSALDASRIAEGREVGGVIVQRRQSGELVDLPYTVDFAFAFRAFFPDAPLHQ
jgi:hypothetical protein